MASGSFGTVFKVQRNSDNRVFVMKRIPLVLDDKHNRSARLRQTLNERHKNENGALLNHDGKDAKNGDRLQKRNANLNVGHNKSKNKEDHGFFSQNVNDKVDNNDRFDDNNIDDLY